MTDVPPKKLKNWPPVAKLTLTSVVDRLVTLSTVGTTAGKVGQNRNTAAPSQLASWTIAWGDGTTQSGTSVPPVSLTRTYTQNYTSVVCQLTVVDVNTLRATANLTVSNIQDPTPPVPPVTAPTAPTNLAATQPTAGQVSLTWTDNASDESAYLVERAEGAGVFVQIASLAAGSTAFLDTGRTPAATYRYRVAASNAAGTSAYTNIVTVTIPAPPATPPVAAFTADQSLLNTGQLLTCSTIGTAAGSVALASWSITWGDGAVESGLGSPASSYPHIFSVAGSYAPRLTVTDTAGNTAAASTGLITVSTPPPIQPPAAPTSLVAALAQPTTIGLTWQDNASNEDRFELERRIPPAAYAQIASLAPNTQTYADGPGLIEGTTYGYRVRAANVGGNSGYAIANEITIPFQTVTKFISWTTGNDTTGDGSQGNPWKTAAKAFSVIGASGADVRVYARGGTYVEAIDTRVTAIPSGTGTTGQVNNFLHPFTFAAFPGETVLFRPGSGDFVTYIAGLTAYVIFDGIGMDAVNVVHNLGKIEAYSSVNNPHHIRVANAPMLGTTNLAGEGSAWLVAAPSWANNVGGNEFLDLAVSRCYGNGAGQGALGYYIQTINNRIGGGSISDVRFGGIQFYNGYNNPVSGNQAYGVILHTPQSIASQAHVALLDYGTANAIFNCLVYNWRSNGGNTRAVELVNVNGLCDNNTLTDVDGEAIYYGGSGGKIRNTIQWQTAGISNAGSSLTLQNNLPLNVNPQFINAAARNYQLGAGSPAIDTGATLPYFSTDLLGVLRPQGAAWDIGCYERVPS